MEDNKKYYDEGIEVCDYIHAHEDTVRSVKAMLPEDETLYDLAELYKIFGDSTRVKILYVLLEAEMCVCDISARYQPIGDFTPAEAFEAVGSDKVKTQRQNCLLFACRRTCQCHT